MSELYVRHHGIAHFMYLKIITKIVKLGGSGFYISAIIFCPPTQSTGIRNVISDEQRAVYNVTCTTIQRHGRDVVV